MQSLHLILSHTVSGEVRVEYIGPDRSAAAQVYSSNIEGAVLVEYFPFLQVSQRRKIAVPFVAKKSKDK